MSQKDSSAQRDTSHQYHWLLKEGERKHHQCNTNPGSTGQIQPQGLKRRNTYQQDSLGKQL